MPRHEEIFQHERADGVGGHAAVAEPDGEHRPVLRRQQRPQLRRKAPHAPAEEMPLPPEIRPQIHRHIAPGGLSDGVGRRRVDDLRARHGIALAQALRLEDPLQPRGAFLPLAENFRRLQGQIGSQSAHDLCPPPLSFHKILCL